ncbi:MAG: heavy metal-associated domain-containing protein [Saprospiraceae bacterium]|nr:heavy metal-associated domain-containing protein [Saprospiraceae bacterium]
MVTIKLKTNLKCSGCVAAVGPHLEQIDGLLSWEADLHAADRIVTVELAHPEQEEQVKEAFKAAGFTASVLSA